MKRLALLLCACLLLLVGCARPTEETPGTEPGTALPAVRPAPTVDETDYAALLTARFADLPAADETDFIFETADGGAKITAYRGAGGNVRVPGTLGGLPVTAVGDGAFAGRDDLQTLVLPETVTSFGTGILEGTALTALRTPFPPGDDAFLGLLWGAETYLDNARPILRGLQYLELRATGAFALPDHALYDCAGLLAVRLPAGATVGDDAFAGCADLRWINAGEIAAVGERAFDGCEALQTLAFGPSLTRIGFAALRDCGGLLELSLPFIGEAPGENAFLGYLFGAKTPALASGFYPPFLQTVALTEGAAVLPDFALFECRSLRRVVLPASLTAIGACAMRGCVALEELSVPAGCAAVGDEACAGCAALGNVTLPDGIAVGVNAFLGTPYAAKKAE